jgi:hypothetical protein
MTTKQKPKWKTWQKITLGIVIGFIVLMVIAVNSDDTTAAKTKDVKPATTEAQPVAETESSYKQIFHFTGTGSKKSETFKLSGNPARLNYKYNTGDMGVFSIYVVPEGEDIQKDGGIPEVMPDTDKTKDSSTSTIHKDAGSYYLDVNATGKWDITVEEK